MNSKFIVKIYIIETGRYQHWTNIVLEYSTAILKLYDYLSLHMMFQLIQFRGNILNAVQHLCMFGEATSVESTVTHASLSQCSDAEVVYENAKW